LVLIAVKSFIGGRERERIWLLSVIRFQLSSLYNNSEGERERERERERADLRNYL
jgi:hypothetical protein